MNLSRSKDLASTLHEVAFCYKEVGRTLNEILDTTKPLKRFMGQPDGRATSSRLITAGIALIAFPDPTITDIMGTALVIAGIMKDRMKETTMIDVTKEIHKITMNLGKSASGLTLDTRM